MNRAREATLLLSGIALGLVAIPSAALAQTVPVYAESPGDALARNVRTLADNPKDFNALVAAGKAALKMGDTQAAVGFFGRAQDVNGNSALPLVGMGAALVSMGDPQTALTYFTRAQSLGASVASFGADRGLAYDLMGKQVVAQTDYRAAMNGPDRDEARRRLSLSLAISGKKTLALSTLEPLLQRGDVAAQRVRALILAVDGDVAGADAALDFTMPGASARMDPFFRRLPALSAGQKAAAVHLGIFPESGVAMASNATSGGDRLASIEDLLSQPDAVPAQPQPPAVNYAYSPTPAPAVAHRQPPHVQVASVSRTSVTRASPNNDLIQTQRVTSDPGGSKIWLQLASGTDVDELPQQFTRIRARKPSLFTGLGGWVADSGSRARLLIGPFHSRDDAQMFADALASARIDAFSWTSQPGQVVRRLPTQ
jgi:Flp pilus assembly protein TadD/cell division septation protein DedD